MIPKPMRYSGGWRYSMISRFLYQVRDEGKGKVSVVDVRAGGPRRERLDSKAVSW